MSRTTYTNLYNITPLQQKIMHYIDYWVHTEKVPIPQKKIIEEMKTKNEASSSVVWSLNSLLRLGYIRRTVATSNKTHYIMLRRI